MNIKEIIKNYDSIPLDQLFKLYLINIYLLKLKNKEINEEFFDSELINYSNELNNKYPSITINDINNQINNINDISSFIYDLINYLNSNKKINEIDSTKQISNIVIDLLSLKNNDIIMDLGSGRGIFNLYTYLFCKENNIKINKILGLEINKEDYILSKIIFRIVDQENKVLFFNSDIKEDLPLNYNKAYSFPPFGIKNNYNSNTIFPNINLDFKNNLSWLFIDKIIKNLDKKGKAVILTFPNALFNENDKLYRNELIKNGYLEGIIELPKGSLIGSNIKACLLVISHNNKNVKLLNLDSLDDVLNKYNNCQTKSCKELINNSNLLPSNLLIEKINFENNIKLSDVSTVMAGSQYTSNNFINKLSNEKTDYNILTPSDIDDESIDFDKLKYINNKDKKLDKYVVQKNDIIITSKSSKTKIAIIDIIPQNKIIVTGGMIIIRPDINKLNPTFFKIYFNSIIGQNMIKSLLRGSTIAILNAKDLMNLSLPNIDINSQNEIANEYNKKFDLLKEYKNKINNLKKDLNIFCNDIIKE